MVVNQIVSWPHFNKSELFNRGLGDEAGKQKGKIIFRWWCAHSRAANPWSEVTSAVHNVFVLTTLCPLQLTKMEELLKSQRKGKLPKEVWYYCVVFNDYILARSQVSKNGPRILIV